MDQTTLITIMAGAVVVSAIALILQAAMLFGTYRATRKIQQRVETVMPKLEGLLDTSRDVLEESRSGIAEVRERSLALLDAGHRQMDLVEEFLTDASSRTRSQLEHAEMVVNDALTRTQETVSLVHKGILKPIRGVTGLAAAAAAAIQFLSRSNRPDPNQVAMDEEMFI